MPVPRSKRYVPQIKVTGLGSVSAPEGLENNEVVYELLADMDGHQIVST